MHRVIWSYECVCFPFVCNATYTYTHYVRSVHTEMQCTQELASGNPDQLQDTSSSDPSQLKGADTLSNEVDQPDMDMSFKEEYLQRMSDTSSKEMDMKVAESEVDLLEGSYREEIQEGKIPLHSVCVTNVAEVGHESTALDSAGTSSRKRRRRSTFDVPHEFSQCINVVRPEITTTGDTASKGSDLPPPAKKGRRGTFEVQCEPTDSDKVHTYFNSSVCMRTYKCTYVQTCVLTYVRTYVGLFRKCLKSRPQYSDIRTYVCERVDNRVPYLTV